MANESAKVQNPGNNNGVEPDGNKPETNEEQKKFFLVRWGEKIAGGARKVKNGVNDFVHKHPYLTAGATGAIGFVGKLAWDHFSESSEVQSETHQVCLPEPEEPEEPTYEITFEPEEEPDMEPASEKDE